MVKNVESGMRDCTVVLDGGECAVVFNNCYRVFSAMNMSDSDIVMSVESGRTAEDDGVRIIEAGGCGMLAHMRSDINTVYITGTGKVHISAGNEAVLPFKAAEKGGDTAASMQLLFDGLARSDSPAVGIDFSRYSKFVVSNYLNTSSTNSDYAGTVLIERDRLEALINKSGFLDIPISTQYSVSNYFSGTISDASFYAVQSLDSSAPYCTRIYGIR